MAIKVGLGAPMAPSAKGISKPAAAQPSPAKILVYRAPVKPRLAVQTNVFEKKTPPKQTFTLPPKPGVKEPMKAPTPVPAKLLPPQQAESKLPQRPSGLVNVSKKETGMPQRQTLKQPVFGNWPKASSPAAAVPTSTPAAPEPQIETATTAAPEGRTVTAAPDALPQEKATDSGGAYVDTTATSAGGSGGGEILSSAEEAAVAAGEAAKTEAATVAQTGRAGLGWVAGLGVAIGAYLYLRRKQ